MPKRYLISETLALLNMFLVKLIKGQFSKETVVLRRWESRAGNLVLTTELKT